ncbi:MAG: TRZ/ATZ family hydrolase [Gammaproteobacteria bacterium]|nr:TRZ/ATZ family hydrolase [Gammaproteobacteria bacterium]MBU1731441.1 TRZ/ATZ family hydrolase [Gammaproteobacteria bacterium]MBU1892946.1 TRZ/ATZ family hydrolase [Gammaproteobacteria bacterium]
MQQADTIIDARWVVPVRPAHQVLHHHSVVIRDGNIAAILPTPEAHAQFSASRTVTLGEHVLIPGLINLHTHAAMNLMRGLADDLPLMEWLQQHIWPAESRHVSTQFVHDGTLLACAEMLRGGITCFNDMYFFPDAAAEAVLKSGMRATIGLITLDFPTPYASDADTYLHKGLAIRDQFSAEPLLSFSLAPHAPYTVSDKTLSKVLTYAEQLDLPIHIHLHETADEIQQSLKQYHLRPLQRLQNLGLLAPNLIAVHAVHLKHDEMATFAQQGCHVAHCPTSNLKLASGIAPVHAMMEQGINVGLGTDGAASNNRLDLFQEMRLAALLAKGISGKADHLPAFDSLQMATFNGARALGLDHQLGSLEPGKAADITAIRLDNLETMPCYDVISHLVYAAGREHVTHVWVNGTAVVENGNLLTLSQQQLFKQATLWQEKIGKKHE